MSLSVDQSKRLDILQASFDELFAKGPDDLQPDEWVTIGDLALLLSQFGRDRREGVVNGYLLVSQLAASKSASLAKDEG